MDSHENGLIRVMQNPMLQAGGGAVLGGFFGLLLRVGGMIPSGPVLLSVAGGALVGGTITRTILRALMGSGEELAKRLVFPDAEGTYAPQYSFIEALEVQEKYREAVDAWLAVADERPNNPSPLLRAADLLLRKLNDSAPALELYDRVRKMPGIREEHIRYSAQKIIDIHLAPGGDEGRALVELRRFVTMFPEGREADGARAAIARIKASRGE